MLTATATGKMTALEMSDQLEWAEITVHFGYGHVSAEGRVKAIQGTQTCVWIGDICLDASTVVTVDDDDENEVKVYPSDQVASR